MCPHSVAEQAFDEYRRRSRSVFLSLKYIPVLLTWFMEKYWATVVSKHLQSLLGQDLGIVSVLVRSSSLRVIGLQI